MRRRDFITLLGSATAAWPVAVNAQQPERLLRIGVLMNRAADNPEGQDRLAAFQQGLQESGWGVGRNVRIDTRWAGAKPDDIHKYAAELVALAPDVILATSGATVGALQQVSRNVPIVFVTVIDPARKSRKYGLAGEFKRFSRGV